MCNIKVSYDRRTSYVRSYYCRRIPPGLSYDAVRDLLEIAKFIVYVVVTRQGSQPHRIQKTTEDIRVSNGLRRIVTFLIITLYKYSYLLTWASYLLYYGCAPSYLSDACKSAPEASCRLRSSGAITCVIPWSRFQNSSGRQVV